MTVLNLKTNTRYRLRNGAIVEVTSLSVPNKNYPVLSFDVSNGDIHSHTLTGKAYIASDDNMEDIIAEVRKPREFWLGKLPQVDESFKVYEEKPIILYMYNNCVEELIHVREVLPEDDNV